MTPDELEETLEQDIGIKKKGHLKRLKALLVVRSNTHNLDSTEQGNKDVLKKSCDDIQKCKCPSIYNLNTVF